MEFVIEDIPVVVKTITFEEFCNSMENQKYRKHYEKLINRAKERVLEGYSEKHHIIPKCLGGSDEEGNLIYLTAEEHYVVHQLLVKLFKSNRKLIHAAILMTSKSPDLKRSGNKAYSWLRKLRSESLIGHIVSDKTRAKISAGHLGRINGPHSKETKIKMSIASKGKPKPESVRLAVAEANRKRIFTDEMRQATRERMLGKTHTEETKRKIGAKSKGRPAPPGAVERCYEMAKNNIGRKMSEEHKVKISAVHKGKTISEEHKIAVANANRNRIFSDETRAKMSANRMGIRPSEETRAKRSAAMKATLAAKRNNLVLEGTK